jgi:hypothetical protein
MSTKNMSSIIVSVFKRNGGEGEFTKVVKQNSDYPMLDNYLHAGEKALIIYYIDEFNFTLLTDNRVIAVNENRAVEILYVNLDRVTYPIFAKQRPDTEISPFRFTKVLLFDLQKNEHLIAVEKGKPWQGFFQALHFITGNPNFAKT